MNMTTGPVAAKASKGTIKIIGDGKYPLVPLPSIEIVERPPEGQDKLFYNPRQLQSFDPAKMRKLQRSIQKNGLLKPPLVRAYTDDKERVTSLELVAGERRFRCCSTIYHNDLPCYSEDIKAPAKYKAGADVLCQGLLGKVIKQSGQTVEITLFDDDDPDKTKVVEEQYDKVVPLGSGKKIYEHLACRLVYNCPDQRALTLAFVENDDQEPLTIAEEIALVERLARLGMKQEKIAEVVQTNITWVSQTFNFRTELPEKAFEMLITGKLKRNVAVSILGYRAEERGALFEATLTAATADVVEKKKALEEARADLEDTEDLAQADLKQAIEAGDTVAEKKLRKKLDVTNRKLVQNDERLDRTTASEGSVTKGHLERGAATVGVRPKREKLLSRLEIETSFIDNPEEWIEKNKIDPICKEPIPENLLRVMQATAQAILSGQTDGMAVIRKVMVEAGSWEVSDNPIDEDDDGFDREDEPSTDDLQLCGDDEEFTEDSYDGRDFAIPSDDDEF